MKARLALISILFLIFTITGISQSAPKQCAGKTKANAQCCNHPMKDSKYCYQHQSQDPNASNQASLKPTFQCGAPTKSGNPCKNRVKTAGTKCHLHTNKP